MFQVYSNGWGSWSVSWSCDVCTESGWPLLRLAGYPTPDAWRLVDEGRAILKGCMVDPNGDTEDYECPKCGSGVDVPQQYRDDDL